jgi:hypothetical protein
VLRLSPEYLVAVGSELALTPEAVDEAWTLSPLCCSFEVPRIVVEGASGDEVYARGDPAAMATVLETEGNEAGLNAVASEEPALAVLPLEGTLTAEEV